MADQIIENVLMTVLGAIAAIIATGALVLLLKLMWNIFKFFWEDLSDL